MQRGLSACRPKTVGFGLGFLFLILHFCLCMFFLTTVSLSSAVFFTFIILVTYIALHFEGLNVGLKAALFSLQ